MRIRKFKDFKLFRENNSIEKDVYNELEVRISGNGRVPTDEIEEVANMYNISVEDTAEILMQVYSDYNKSKDEYKDMELENISDMAYISCRILGDTSFECFEEEFRYQVENTMFEESDEDEALSKIKELYEKSKGSNYPFDETSVYRDDVKEVVSKYPNRDNNFIINQIHKNYIIPLSPRVLNKIISEFK